MIGALRELGFLALAVAISWWLFLGGPVQEVVEPAVEPPDARVLPVAVMPQVVAAEPPAEPESEQPPAPADEPRPEPAPDTDAAAVLAEALPSEDAPPPPRPDTSSTELAEVAPEAASELASLEDGVPDGADEGAPADVASVHESGRSASELERDPELAAAAHAELSGEVRRGFDTVLLAAPEEQLDIARAFGEELVLVPRRALDPDSAPHYFRLDLAGTPRVERVAERPPLELRRYRDLFDYEYARLPEGLRVLRRSVLARSEVYVFAALIPLSEWAVVVGRRREALDATGLTPDDVRRFDLRYVQTPQGSFDLRVESIVLADGRSISLPGRPEPRKNLR